MHTHTHFALSACTHLTFPLPALTFLTFGRKDCELLTALHAGLGPGGWAGTSSVNSLPFASVSLSLLPLSNTFLPYINIWRGRRGRWWWWGQTQTHWEDSGFCIFHFWVGMAVGDWVGRQWAQPSSSLLPSSLAQLLPSSSISHLYLYIIYLLIISVSSHPPSVTYDTTVSVSSLSVMMEGRRRKEALYLSEVK